MVEIFKSYSNITHTGMIMEMNKDSVALDVIDFLAPEAGPPLCFSTGVGGDGRYPPLCLSFAWTAFGSLALCGAGSGVASSSFSPSF